MGQSIKVLSQCCTHSRTLASDSQHGFYCMSDIPLHPRGVTAVRMKYGLKHQMSKSLSKRSFPLRHSVMFRRMVLWDQITWVQISVILLTSTVTLDNMFNPSVFQYPHVWERDDNDTYFIGSLWEFTRVINIKCYEKGPAYSWHSTNISNIIISTR